MFLVILSWLILTKCIHLQCHNWFDAESDIKDFHQVWCETFSKLTSLCNELRCNLLAMSNGHEVFSVATLNLVSWTWENLGDHFDGFFELVHRSTMYALQTGEFAIFCNLCSCALFMVELLSDFFGFFFYYPLELIY